VAVLGDMKELGDHAAEAHTSIGRLDEMAHVELLVTVGHDAALIDARAPGREVVRFADAAEASAEIVGLLRAKDIVLVKGSRAMGMEQVTEAVLGSRRRPGECETGHGEPCPEGA